MTGLIWGGLPALAAGPTANNSTNTMAVLSARCFISLPYTDPDGGTMTFTLVNAPSQGSLEYRDAGSYTDLPVGLPVSVNYWYYTSKTTSTGSDSFAWQVSDGTATSALATVTILLTTNTPIVANATTNSVVAGTVSYGVWLSNTDPDSYQPKAAQLVAPPARGTLEWNTAGSYVTIASNDWTQFPPSQSPYWYYTSSGTNAGTDSFKWRITDGLSTSAVVTMTMTLTTNTPPVANGQAQTVALGSVRYSVYLSCTHPDYYQSLSYKLVTPPALGILEYNTGGGYSQVPTDTTVNANSWYYTPSGTTTGSDTFTWWASDGMATSAAATATLNLVSNNVPSASNQGVSLLRNNVRKLVSLSSCITHSDSYQSMSYLLTAGPSNGVAEYQSGTNWVAVPVNSPISLSSWYYTPASNYVGGDSFKWRVSDGVSTSGVATLSFTVTSNHPPVATTIHAVCPPDSSVTIAANYQDLDAGQTWTASVVGNAASGNVTVVGTTFTYTPSPGFRGMDRFTYRVNDGVDDSGVATGLIQVRAANERAGGLVILVVNDLLLPQLSNEVYRLKADLANEGYAAAVKPWTLAGSTPSNLWAYLVGEYNKTNQFLVGTVLIGDVPKPQVTNTGDGQNDGTSFYTDLVYWNLQYYQTAQTYSPPRSIWVSRINTPGTYGTEVTLLRRALDANHDYRTGASRLPYKAFYFMIPGWWGSYGDSNNVARLKEVWPDAEGRAEDSSHAAFLPGRTDLHVGKNYAGADCLAAGGEIFDETSHGNTSGFMSQAGSADFSTGWVVIDMIYRIINQIRFVMDGSCDNGCYNGPANNMITTRGGGCVLAVGGSAINWAGDFVISEDTTADNNFRKLIKAGESMGTAGVQYYAYDSLYNDRTIFFGDLSLGVMAAPSNSLPVLQSFTNSTPPSHPPFTVNFTVSATDPDGTISNVEWFLGSTNGYDCGRATPTISGAATNVQWTYPSGGVYQVRVEVLDNFKARSWQESTLTVNTPPVASNDTASVVAGRSVVIPVLGNDFDPDGNPISIQSRTQPAHGSAATNGTTIIYTSTNYWQGTDFFNYTIVDSLGGTATATVSVAVCFDPVPPVAGCVLGGATNLLRVTFSKPLDPVTAQNPTNYTLNHGATVLAAVLGLDRMTVTLLTSGLVDGIAYALTLNRVKDDVPFAPNTIAANTERDFVFRSVPGFRLPVTFGGYSAAEPLTNFPALVVLNEGLPGFLYNQFAKTQGGDLRFYAADEGMELPYEVEQWNTNGSSYVWVRVPVLTNNTMVLAEWGRTNQADRTPWTSNTATWAQSYLGVWHMSQIQALDSTTNQYNGSAQGTVSQVVAGAAGPANRVKGSAGYIKVPDSGAFTMTGPYTIGAWFWSTNAPGTQGLLGTYDGSVGFILAFSSGTLQFWDGGWHDSGRSPGIGVWNYIVYTRSGTTNRFYINGANITNLTSGAATGNGTDLWLGAAHWNDSFNGLLDEVRLSCAARSTNWVWAEWMTVASNAVFCQYGPTQATGRPCVDACGIPDAWKVFYFGATNAPLGGALDDWDGDGMNNLSEWFAGTDPTSGQSCLKLRATAGQAATQGFDFDTTAGYTYSVYRKTNLMDAANWQLFTNFISVGGPSRVPFTGAPPQGYFRVQVNP